MLKSDNKDMYILRYNPNQISWDNFKINLVTCGYKIGGFFVCPC